MQNRKIKEPVAIDCYIDMVQTGFEAEGGRTRSRHLMKRFEFHLHITSARYLGYYRGTAKQVLARSVNGSTVQFPASLLQKFVTSDGIDGDFVLTCDDDFKNAKLDRAFSRK